MKLFITIMAMVFTDNLNYINRIHNGLYMCHTYCFTYNHNKLSLNKLLCNNEYIRWSIGSEYNTQNIFITNTSCNDLYTMSFGSIKYKYSNPPYLEKFCNATNINCNVQCNPYELYCTI